MTRALLLALLILPAQAQSHSFYSTWCCGGDDCGPVPDSAVEFTPSGWFVRQTGETIPFNETKPSPDGRFHICILPTSPDHVRCLYGPGFGS